MRFPFLILTLLLTATFGFTQERAPQLTRETKAKVIKKGINFTIEKVNGKKYVYKQFFVETKQLMFLMTFSDKECSIRSGQYKEWFDNGEMVLSGSFKNGKQHGFWREDFDENKSHKYGTYKNGIKEGDWITYDSLGNTKVIEPFLLGKKEGTAKHFNSSAQLVKEVYYENDLDTGEKIIIDEGIADQSKETFSIVEIRPSFPGCEAITDRRSNNYRKCTERKMLEYIYQNITYPRFARENNIQGTAKVRFAIDKEGNVEQVEVLRGFCNDMKKVCHDIVANMPQWHPGYQTGKPATVFFNLPIKFRLE